MVRYQIFPLAHIPLFAVAISSGYSRIMVRTVATDVVVQAVSFLNVDGI